MAHQTDSVDDTRAMGDDSKGSAQWWVSRSDGVDVDADGKGDDGGASAYSDFAALASGSPRELWIIMGVKFFESYAFFTMSYTL